MTTILGQLSSPVRILLIVAMMLALHWVVLQVRRMSRKIMAAQFSPSLFKARTLVSLATSVTVFVLYFAAFGLILKEFGVSLTAYLASASILGLAIGFGSQGLVQDVVTGLTLVFANLIDVGNMVEIAGQTGIVRSVGMRFTIIENSFGAEVFIPNRTIANVVKYPRGYVRGLADITLSGDRDTADRMEQRIATIVSSAIEQFPGILLAPPSIEGRVKTRSGKEFLRIKFRLWPGRGAPIEGAFKQEVVQALKALDAGYADWMVSVNYEVEKKSVSLSAPGGQRRGK